MARNYFELEPGAPGRAPYCPTTGYNGCAVCVCADIIEAYTGTKVTDLMALGQLMGEKHRAIDPSCRHGVCPEAWCIYCIYLECHSRGIPVGYARLSWAQITTHLEANHHVAAAVIYGEIGYVQPGSYDDTTPAAGRSDTYTGRHALDLYGTTGGHIRVLDPDFGNYRGTPPYSLLDAGEVQAAVEALDYQVCYTTAPPGHTPAPGPAAPSHNAKVTTGGTHLFNPVTKRLVYSLKVGTALVVGGHASVMGGKNSFPVRGPAPYTGYYVPVANVRLTP